MKINGPTSWASSSFTLLLHIPVLLAQPTATSSSASTTTSAAPSCTASLVTELCDYKEPTFAVAEDSLASCWSYCHSHQPCDFVIWNPGNPYLGTGTCWVYPGQKFEQSSDSGCSGDNTTKYLEVYDTPVCDDEEPTATSTSGACAATATPSAIAEVCDYPPPDDCNTTGCVASDSTMGSTFCLSVCAKADSCNYVIFRAGSEDKSQYGSGTCWLYSEGSYNAKDATACKSGEDTELYVYKNPCPKPKPKSTSTSSTSTPASDSAKGSSTADSSADGDDDSEDAAPAAATFSLTGLAIVGVLMLL